MAVNGRDSSDECTFKSFEDENLSCLRECCVKNKKRKSTKISTFPFWMPIRLYIYALLPPRNRALQMSAYGNVEIEGKLRNKCQYYYKNAMSGLMVSINVP